MPRSNGGPRTQAGKPALSRAEEPALERSEGPALERSEGTGARRNALKHGLTSTNPVIEGMERQSDWRHHLDGIVASLEPEGALEEALAQRVASLLWRLHRVTRYEVAAINQQGEQTVMDLAAADMYLQRPSADEEIPDPDPEDVARAQETRIIPTGAALDKIMRYETHLHRQWMQTLHEIEALQSRRRGEQTHLARLDVSASPS